CAASYSGTVRMVSPVSLAAMGRFIMLMRPFFHDEQRTGEDYAGSVSTQRVFVARLAGCSVFDPAGDRLGRVRDVVVVFRSSGPPRVIGLVCEIPGRRQVFLSIGRVTSIQS